MMSGPQMVEGSLILLSSQLPRQVRHPPPLIHQTRPQQTLHKCPLFVVAEEVGSEGGEGAVVQIVETAEIQIPTIITKTDSRIIQTPTKIKSQVVKSLTSEVPRPVRKPAPRPAAGLQRLLCLTIHHTPHLTFQVSARTQVTLLLCMVRASGVLSPIS